MLKHLRSESRVEAVGPSTCPAPKRLYAAGETSNAHLLGANVAK